MIQITYLILAHKSPAQLLRLLSSLRGENINFVIHIDGNTDVDVFRNCISGRIPRVQFVEDRVPVEWGRYAMIEASLAGLSYTLDHFPDTKRIVLLSGQDYPIKSNTYIRKYFEANQDKIFLSYFKIPYKRWFQGGIRRFPHYQRISGIMQFYAGSQWWSITNEVARYILDFINQNPAFVDYFKMVDVPDESFFHTLLLNSEEPLIIDKLVNCNLHLIKWKPPYMHPICLTSSNRNIIKRSKYLFARKFEHGISDSILNFIDKEVRGAEAISSNLENESGSTASLINQASILLNKRNNRSILEYYRKFKEQHRPFGESAFFYHSTSDEELFAGSQGTVS